MDYKTYRVNIVLTIDVDVPPGVDDANVHAQEMAEAWMADHAPAVDYTIADAEDITVEHYYDDQKYDLWKEEQPDPREYDV